jgi:hypothetical protein
MARHRTRQECLDRLRAEACDVAPGQKAGVDVFRPEDAEGIARLYYAIYGDSFPIDYLYDPDRIREANLTEDLYHVVGRTESGDIVGVSGMFRAAPGKGILESGGLMILRDYRQGLLLYRLYDLTQKIARGLPWLNAEYSQMVTDMETPQKMSNRFGARGLALELDAMGPRPGGDGRRITLVDEFIVLRDVLHDIYLPERYAELLRGQYASFGLARRFLPNREADGVTRWSRSELPQASLAKVLVTRIGADFEGMLREAAQMRDAHVLQLHLPLSDTGLPQAVELARAQGFWLGGLLPLWTDADVLLLQKLAATPDFDAPFLLTAEVQALMRLVRADCEAVCGALPAREG